MGWLKRKLPQKRWKRVLIYIASTFLILLALDMALVQYWRQVTISPETTRITSPLNQAGYPDYVAALNAKYAQGVTVENNAAVPLLKLLSEDDAPESWTSRALPPLGIIALADKPRIQKFEDWVKANPPADGAASDADKGPEDSLDKPWTRAQQPRWSAYLDAHREALALALEASRRERYYVPLLAPKATSAPGDMVQVLLPHLSKTRTASTLLCADAMLALGENDLQRAQDRTLAVLRLGRLSATGPTLIDQLVGMAIETRGHATLRAIVASGKLTPQQLESLRNALAQPMPAPQPDQAFDLGERYMMLDSFCWIAKDGPMVMQMVNGGSVDNSLGTTALRLFLPVNIDAGMRYTNTAYDQIVAAVQMKDYHESRKALQNIEDVFSRQPRSVSTLFTRPHAVFVSLLLPSMQRIREVQEQLLVERELTQLALALAQHHATHNAYPEKLDLPRDRFAADGSSLRYRREANGYILYSVGPDGRDDKGVTGSRASRKPWDMVTKVEKP